MKTPKNAEAERSLFDDLAKELGCTYISDLAFLSDRGKSRLIELLRGIPAEHYSLWDWNDALGYFTHAPKQQTVQDARCTLLDTLESETE